LILSGLLLKRKCVSEALWILFLAHASLVSVRHVPLYVSVAAPVIASELSGLWTTLAASFKKGSVLRILHQLGEDIAPSFRWTSVWPLAVVVALAAIDAPIQWPRDFPADTFPVHMVHANAGLLQSGRVLTVDQWADYLIYWNYPRQRVFVDGRSDFYGEIVAKDYLHLLQGNYDWQAIMNRWDFDRALLPPDWPLASILKLDRSWRVVQDDGEAILFLRRPTRSTK